MLAFSANIQVIRKLKSSKTFNGYLYDGYLVNLSEDITINAYIPAKMKINEGDCFTSNNVYLTPFDKNFEEQILGVRIDRLDKVDNESFVLPKNVLVRANGKLIRTNRSTVKRVGAEGRLFLAASIVIKDEYDGYYPILLAAHDKYAKLLSQHCTNTFMDIEGRLKKQLKKDDFEVTLRDLRLTEKEQRDE